VSSEKVSFSAPEAIWEVISAFDWASVIVAVWEHGAERARRDSLVRWTQGRRKKTSGAARTTSPDGREEQGEAKSA
jgi:hypothetical protein